MFDFANVRPGIVNMLKVNMNLKKGESVLILNDVPGLEEWRLPWSRVNNFVVRSLMVRNIYQMINEEFGEHQVDYLVYRPAGQNGAEPPDEVAEKLLDYDVVLAITTFSLSHTRARENATRKGARIASLPGLELSMLMADGPMAADYDAIQKDTGRIARMLTGANSVRVTTELGTDLFFSIENRKGGADTGIIAQKGQWGNLPGGEAFIAPVEGTARGRLVVPAGWYGGLKEDMELEFQEGNVVSLQGGGETGENFRKILSFDDDTIKHRRNCAELGIGTNPQAKKPDNVLEAEKIKGTVHIAIGDSSHLGGVTESDLHEDFVLPEPTLYLDGEVVMEKGQYLVL